jgi:hypothetical protein
MTYRIKSKLSKSKYPLEKYRATIEVPESKKNYAFGYYKTFSSKSEAIKWISKTKKMLKEK